MFKKVELLNKQVHKDLKIDVAKDLNFTKGVRHIPLGMSEVRKVASFLPVVISGGEDQQFSAIISLTEEDNYFTKDQLFDYVPAFLKAYPFLMVDAKDEVSGDMVRAIALDVESELIGEDKKNSLFENDQLSQLGETIVKDLNQFDQDRANMVKLVNDLKKYKLLDKRNIDINIDGEVKTILSDFYVVNRERLMKLDDAILLKWAKSGVLFLLEAHMASVENVSSLLKK